MNISPIFMFAPVPLTSERSPLAHAAAIVRRRLADNPIVAVPRYRIPPASTTTTTKKTSERAAA